MFSYPNIKSYTQYYFVCFRIIQVDFSNIFTFYLQPLGFKNLMIIRNDEMLIYIECLKQLGFTIVSICLFWDTMYIDNPPVQRPIVTMATNPTVTMATPVIVVTRE